MRTALAPALLLAVVASASAQDPIDLSQAAGYRPVVGDKVRRTKVDRQVMDTVARQAGQPDQTKHEEKGYEAVWTDEVQAVTEDGKKAARTLRTYERFQDLRRNEAVAVDGVQVVITVDAVGTHAFAPAEGSAPVPPSLMEALTEETERATKKAGKKEATAVLLPRTPQAVGATWEVDAAEVAAGMDVGSPGDLLADQSSVRGTLVSVKEEGGVRVATLTYTIKLAFSRLKAEMPLSEPALLDLSMEVRLPVAGDAPTGGMTSKGTFGASPAPPNLPQGMTMRVDIAMDGAERRERVGP